MDLRQLFANNLRKARYKRGISQERLALDAGVDRAYMSRVERGVTYVGLEIVGKLVDVLDIEPTELFQKPPKRSSRKKTG
jgi:transcriptional regulator with XRE-family HTH domain